VSHPEREKAGGVMTDREAENEALRAWCRQLAVELGVTDLEVDLPALLGLAGRASRAILRPAAPLTTFLVGYAAGVRAAGEGVSPQAAVRSATDSAVALCRAEQAPTG
jgi:hypothetical protein